MASPDSPASLPPGWRDETWARLAGPWDLVIVGGGITGAGVFAAAGRLGLSALLLEQGDFASATSSRSSKLVHGGLRYLKQGRLHLTIESVRERQRLLRAAPGLVDPLPFLYLLHRRAGPAPWAVGLGLALYTHLTAGTGGYQRLSGRELARLEPKPHLAELAAAYRYQDAQTDDARLVLRVIEDALESGGARTAALSYARAEALLRSAGRVRGVAVRDLATGLDREVSCRVVVNASGPWTDAMRALIGARPLLRPLRGSHLYLDPRALPLAEAVAFHHPLDRRPIFAYPWQGVTLVGTTDVDHSLPLDREPAISQAEADYLMDGLRTVFPDLDLGPAQVISTQAGVRPVIDTGRENASAESREHLVLEEDGLITVTGGKLTTFRSVALAALRAVHALDPDLPAPRGDLSPLRPLAPPEDDGGLEPPVRDHLLGRYRRLPGPLATGDTDALRPIAGTPYLHGELLWSAAQEGVVHLSDLMLRRFRLGILLPDGGKSLLAPLERPLRRLMGWDEARWSAEVADFQSEHSTAHGPPDGW